MPTKHYESSEAKCPFYHKERSLAVYCDGIDGSASTIVNFDMEAQKRYFCAHYCRSAKGWKDCKIAKILIEERDGYE
ncbi:MAG: hypothetical protein ACI3XR_02540 [Eubacteriales bacterium]